MQPRPSPAANFVDSGPSASEQVETIAEEANGDLEVVDFFDTGKFVGIAEAPKLLKRQKRFRHLLSPLSHRDLSQPISLTNPLACRTVYKQVDFGAW